MQIGYIFKGMENNFLSKKYGSLNTRTDLQLDDPSLQMNTVTTIQKFLKISSYSISKCDHKELLRENNKFRKKKQINIDKCRRLHCKKVHPPPKYNSI